MSCSGQQQQPPGRSRSSARKQVTETDWVQGLPRPHWVLLDST